MTEGFAVGQEVCVRADPTRQGIIQAILPAVGGRARYRVYHGPGHVRDYTADQVRAIAGSDTLDNLMQALLAGRWLSPEAFRARLTAARLAHPQIDTLYALHAARIQWIPFQFKPLLRFLRADRPRLLIADEVGVGKTIEAGLILKELQTRQQVENVLIVCPKALVTKWQAEMRRFDEAFRPLTGETLRYCLQETHRDGAWPSQYARAIVHLELVRNDGYLGDTNDRRRPRPGLLNLDPAPRFDLVIVDEAHHMRNPGTNSYELAQFLGDVSEALIFLSATPVHLGAQNLQALLHVLRPDLFPDGATFAETIAPNHSIFEAMRLIRQRDTPPAWHDAVAQALEQAASTTWGQQVLRQDIRFRTWYDQIRAGVSLSDTERIRCLRDLEEMHSLAHVMNRTRRRDIGRFTLREPHTVTVPFTPAQQTFYTELIAFRRAMLACHYDPRVVRLISNTLERQAASCLHALVPSLDIIIRSGRITPGTLSDTADDEDDDGMVLPDDLRQQAEALRQLAAALPPDDPKLDQLCHLLQTTLDQTGPGKVLIFSFFLHTLAYLQHHLHAAGYRVALITGQVPDKDREDLRTRFRYPRTNPEAVDILLSSEVGCEGLDYEFCDRLVNYDIPWNPMRVEQRIGRIDRFGQTSDKVLIFNFVTPGTVEEQIFYRCFERLGIFANTVGDLEAVLGEVTHDLTRIALDPTLTETQASEQAHQAADNVLRQIEEQQRVEQEGGDLLGLDQVVMAEVHTLLAEGRFVAADDLRQMITTFLDTPAISGKLTPDSRQPTIERLRLSRDGRRFLLDHVRRLAHDDQTTVTFRRWLEGSDASLAVTFDQHTAVEQRDLPFITPVHPLARIAIAEVRARPDALTIQARVCTAMLPPGWYVFVCDLWETIAIRPEIRFVSYAWNSATRMIAPDVSAALGRLLHQIEPCAPHRLSAEILQTGLHALDEAAEAARLVELDLLRERNDNLVDRRLASLDASYRNRRQRVDMELARATEERIQRMKQSEQRRITQDYDQKRAEIGNRRTADIVSNRIAAGILYLQEPDIDA